MVAAVLLGNRNFEGRINPHVRMNYLASPPLVGGVRAGRDVNIDLDTRSRWGHDRNGRPRVPEGHLAERRGDRAHGR